MSNDFFLNLLLVKNIKRAINNKERKYKEVKSVSLSHSSDKQQFIFKKIGFV